MARLLQTLIPILFLLTTARSEVPPSSTSFFYYFHSKAPTMGLTFQGVPPPLWGQNFLRLTNPVNNSVGRVLYTNPVQFSQTGGQVNFETTFTFVVSPLDDITPADGIVFFIAPVGTAPPNGGGGGNFGVFEASGNSLPVFTVEFDTFINEWDPNYRHIGIDLGSSRSVVTTEVGDALLGQQLKATVSYAAATGTISVLLEAGSEKFELSYDYDLRELLPQQVQVGLSAATGGKIAAHDVVYWYFASKMVSTGAATAAKGRKQLIRQFV